MLIEPSVIEDHRGFFMETYKASDFRAIGILGEFRPGQSFPLTEGVLRGLHFQRPPHAQAKLVRVIAGAAWDVAADLRRGSPSFGRWYGLELECAKPTDALYSGEDLPTDSSPSRMGQCSSTSVPPSITGRVTAECGGMILILP